MEDGYPQDLSRWQGLSDKIDSVFTNSVDGNIFTFQMIAFWVARGLKSQHLGGDPRIIGL